MEQSNLNILKDLENFLSYDNIESLKRSFISSCVEYDNNPISSDQELGIFEYHGDVELSTNTFKFENDLKKTLDSRVVLLKVQIDELILSISSSEKRKLEANLKSTLQYIEKKERKLLSKFTVCKDAIDQITYYLESKYNFDIKNSITLNSQESLFKIKAGIKKSIFAKLYDLTIASEFIDDEFTSEESFLSVLRDKETKQRITFTSKNSVTVLYLETIKTLFDNLKPTTIEESGRFITKNKSILTASNYYKSKSNAKNQDIKEIHEFKRKFNNLLK